MHCQNLYSEGIQFKSREDYRLYWLLSWVLSVYLLKSGLIP